VRLGWSSPLLRYINSVSAVELLLLAHHTPGPKLRSSGARLPLLSVAMERYEWVLGGFHSLYPCFFPLFSVCSDLSRGCGSVPFDSIGFAPSQAIFSLPLLVRAKSVLVVVVDADFWRSSIDQRLLSLLVARRFFP
jgi:hypothetical protein